MGAVYLAERVEGDFSQVVALKLLAPHLVEERFAERFRAERQVLASLSHPHIVRFLDGGLSEKGEPFLATEYIEGAALDRFANGKRLDVRGRIRLFLQVCAAVEYAHQNLIVHRDLKPSNILVTQGGTAKLLDFGTAKLLGAGGERTATDALQLTPKYASPEQLRNEAITTRSDIYSLGMILYESLSGARPFDSTGDAIGELARAYEFAQPAPLGKRLNAEAAAQRSMNAADLLRELSGDLRAVVGKAIEHAPERRYSSVRELANDLSAYLESRPVTARNPDFWYVAGKFLYRNRWAAAAVALLLVAIGVGVWTTVLQKSRAERRFAQVRQLARYQLFELYDEAEKILGSTRLRARLAEEALRYLDGLRSDAAGDVDLQLELAKGYLRVGDVWGNYTKDNLGERERARESCTKALAMVSGLSGDAAAALRAEISLAQTMADYASEQGKGNWSARLESAVKEFEGLNARAPKSVASYLALGNAYSAVARVRQAPEGRMLIEERSEEWVNKAQQAFEAGLSYDAGNEQLIAALHRLAASQAMWTCDTRPQVSLRWSSVGERWALQRKQSRATPDYLATESRRLSARAAAYSALGDQEEALKFAKAAAQAMEQLATDEDNFGARLNYMAGLANWAAAEYELGHKQENFEISKRLLELAEHESRGPRGSTKPVQQMRWKALYDAAYAYMEAERPDRLEVVERAYKAFVDAAAADPNNERVRFFLCDILLILAAPGYERPDEAKRYASEMIAAVPESPNGYDFLAQSKLAMKNIDGAIEAYRKAMSVLNAARKGAAGAKFQKFYEEKIAELTARSGRTNQ
jgi:tRNA A-37 threonylcarbamoyl transferase component Bud32